MRWLGNGEVQRFIALKIVMYHANRDRVICLSRKGSAAMKRLFLLAALGGLILTTSAVPADAAPRNRSASQGQKANRQSRSANKANRNRAPRSTAAG